MSNANPATHDEHRLAVLRDTQLLDTAPEECFDRLTRLAASMLHVPLAYLSLVDQTRDFCKSGFGLPAWLAEKREISGDTLARHTIARGAPLVIADARTNAESCHIPIIESLSAASYAGVPISIDGAAIGSLCVVDTKVRQWSRNDIEILEELARTVVREIEMQRGLRTLERKADPPSSLNEPWITPAEVTAAEKDTDAKRVVIAEDDASMRRLMVRVLSPDGYQLLEARDGREALNVLRRQQTSMLVLDLVMPGISGWDVLEERMKDTALRVVPVIVVSAKRGPDIARALAYGVFGLLPKPFDPADFRDLVNTCMRETRSF